MKNALLVTTIFVTALSVSACKPKATDLPPGEYKNSTTSTDANGTEHEKDTTTNVQQNSDGSKSATTHSETTRDPEGLLNKETTGESTTHEDNR